jgi:hypothetical protein
VQADAPTFIPVQDTVLQSLQAQLSAAIDSLNFPVAHELQEKIRKYHADNADSQVSDLRQELDRQLDVVATSNRRRRFGLLRSFHARELSERRAIDAAYEQTRARHLTRLAALQASLLAEYRAEMSKPNLRYNELIEQARANAARMDYERAERDQDEANVARDAENARRQEIYERSYKNQMAAALRQQDLELEALQKKARDAIGDLEKQRETALAKDLARFRKELRREYKQRADQFAIPMKRVSDRKFAADCLNGLEDTYRMALVRFGLATAEDKKRPPLLVVSAKGETTLPLRVQSRIDSRARASTPTTKSTGNRTSRPDSKFRE